RDLRCDFWFLQEGCDAVDGNPSLNDLYEIVWCG
ncbi:unnamed protein product, partial [Mycena citricolor]